MLRSNNLVQIPEAGTCNMPVRLVGKEPAAKEQRHVQVMLCLMSIGRFFPRSRRATCFARTVHGRSHQAKSHGPGHPPTADWIWRNLAACAARTASNCWENDFRFPSAFSLRSPSDFGFANSSCPLGGAGLLSGLDPHWARMPPRNT